MRLMAHLGVRALAAIVVGAGALVAPRPTVADPPPSESARERYNLSPSYHAGESYRVIRKFRQTTVTAIPQGRLRPMPPVNFSDYDAYVDVDVLVTIEQVDETGDAQVWSIRFDRLRYNLPNPVESKTYRDRDQERKREGLERDAHPLEGETLKFDRSGKKTRIYKVLKNGEDAAVTQRYPEILPFMQELVEPDWVPVDTVPLFGEWVMDADTIFRTTRVLLRAPMKGKFICRLASVADGIAVIEIRAILNEEWARVSMTIDAKGKILFDLAKRRPIRADAEGEVQISSRTSAMRGMGKLTLTSAVEHLATSPGNR